MICYILDTDHFSLWQINHPLVVNRIKTNANNISITIITAEELIRGRLNVIRQTSQTSALATNSILITRNSRDFNKIPHLRFEDWTIPE